MTQREIKKLLEEKSFVRTSASPEEFALACFFRDYLAEKGLSSRLVPFPVPGYRHPEAALICDGKQIPCLPIFGFGTGKVEAPLFYARRLESATRGACRGKIVLLDGPLRSSAYDFLTDAGALAVIASCGDMYSSDRALDQRARSFTLEGKALLPCLMIHVKDTVKLVSTGAKHACLSVDFERFNATSHNLIVDLPGSSEERIDICAHYDSTALSCGSYDNLSGALALLYLARYFQSRAHERSIRLVFCGSEETGLMGSLSYCACEEIKGAVLNINLDMLGSVMGAVEAISCADENMEKYLASFLRRRRIPASVRHGIRSSDSTSFAYFGVPAVSFARFAPYNTARIHTLDDLPETVSPARLLEDMRMVATFTEKVASLSFPVPFVLSEYVKTESEKYMKRHLLPPFSE